MANLTSKNTDATLELLTRLVNQTIKPGKHGKKDAPIKYGKHRTIIGQELTPAELMKRHLAGTLPDLDQSLKYVYHYDQDGKQIGEPIPLEYHELLNLVQAHKQKLWDEAVKHRAEQAEKLQQKIIAEYVASQAASNPKPPEGTEAKA